MFEPAETALQRFPEFKPGAKKTLPAGPLRWIHHLVSCPSQHLPKIDVEQHVLVVPKWQASAGKYEQNRKQSAMTQLVHEGASDERVNRIVNDPVQLRQYIQSRCRELIKDLKSV